MIPVEDQIKVKRTIKDSVFTDLFGDSRYVYQLYQALHPEDHDVKERDFSGVKRRRLK